MTTETQVGISIQELFYSFSLVFSFAAGWVTLKIRSKNNQKTNESLIEKVEQVDRYTNKEINDLKNKCNEMIKEKTARETFVHKDIFKAEIAHINKTLDKVDSKTEKILEFVKR